MDTEVRATGRVVSSWRAMLLRVEGHWTWYRRYWRSSLYTSGLQPVLFLGAMGLGFGSQVRPSQATGGYDYLHYVAPSLLVVGALFTAFSESSFPVLSGFKWQKDYIAVTSTPITPGQLLGGQLLWVASRLLLSASVYAAVAWLLGAWLNFGVLLVVLVGVFTGVACAAPVMALAAGSYDEGYHFVLLLRLGILPMMLFAGTLFPIERVPELVRPVVLLLPLWHGNELARGVTLGGLDLLPALGHVAYLAALLVGGALLARRLFYRRLVV